MKLAVSRVGATRECALQKSLFVEIVRLLLVLVFTAVGLGVSLRYDAALAGTVIGAGVGYVLGGVFGRFLRTALGEVEVQTERFTAGQFVAGAIGALLVGLLGALVGAPAIGLLPGPWGWPVFCLIVWIAVNLGFRITWKRSSEILSIVGLSEPSPVATGESPNRDAVLIDTSVLIDGRLLRLARTGFLHRNLLVPCFVLDELQGLADSHDPTVRRKGRTGLEMLEAIRRDALLQVHVPKEEIPEIETVDAKLVALATRLSVSLLTNDDNLSHVAELRGVRCLSLHRLVKSLSAVLTHGELVNVSIVKEGQHPGEGVGYLQDGSMVVVSDSADRADQDVDVVITTSVRTPRGIIFFASLKES